MSFTESKSRFPPDDSRAIPVLGQKTSPTYSQGEWLQAPRRQHDSWADRESETWRPLGYDRGGHDRVRYDRKGRPIRSLLDREEQHNRFDRYDRRERTSNDRQDKPGNSRHDRLSKFEKSWNDNKSDTEKSEWREISSERDNSEKPSIPAACEPPKPGTYRAWKEGIQQRTEEPADPQGGLNMLMESVKENIAKETQALSQRLQPHVDRSQTGLSSITGSIDGQQLDTENAEGLFPFSPKRMLEERPQARVAPFMSANASPSSSAKQLLLGCSDGQRPTEEEADEGSQLSMDASQAAALLDADDDDSQMSAGKTTTGKRKSLLNRRTFT